MRESDKIHHSGQQNIQMLVDFVGYVKRDCVMDKIYFNFHYIPDLIIKQGYLRKDYEKILKLLNKTKGLYIKSK